MKSLEVQGRRQGYAWPTMCPKGSHESMGHIQSLHKPYTGQADMQWITFTFSRAPTLKIKDAPVQVHHNGERELLYRNVPLIHPTWNLNPLQGMLLIHLKWHGARLIAWSYMCSGLNKIEAYNGLLTCWKYWRISPRKSKLKKDWCLCWKTYSERNQKNPENEPMRLLQRF